MKAYNRDLLLLSERGIVSVSTTEEVESTEAKMNAARDALMDYIERRQAIDRDLYRRLTAQLKKAQADFLRAISELGE